MTCTTSLAAATVLGAIASTVARSVDDHEEMPTLLAPGEGRLQIRGAGGTKRGQERRVAPLGEVGNDDIRQSESVTDGFLQVAVDAFGWDDDGPHYPEHRGLLQEPRDARLRNVQPVGDLRLAQALLVIHASDLGQQRKPLGWQTTYLGHVGTVSPEWISVAGEQGALCQGESAESVMVVLRLLHRREVQLVEARARRP